LFFPFAPADIAVITVVSDHLFSLVGNMGAHGSEPLDGVEGLLILSILRTVEDLGLFRDIMFSLATENAQAMTSLDSGLRPYLARYDLPAIAAAVV